MKTKTTNPDKYLDYLQSNVNQEVYNYAEKLYAELIRVYPPLKMIKIERVSISGIYPIKSDEIIEFNSNFANIVYGGNGAGKTTCLESIEFGLLGSKTIEIKNTFGKRIINKFVVEIILRIENVLYSLKRWMISPDSHNVSFTRISEQNDKLTAYPSSEGYRETENELHKLTGLNLTDIALIYDFFTLRVPRNHYLSNTIKGNNGSYIRELLLSKLVDPANSLPNIIVQQAMKLLHEGKTKFNRLLRRINLLESLEEDKAEQKENITDIKEAIENDLIEISNKLAVRKTMRKNLFDDIQKNLSNESILPQTLITENTSRLLELQSQLVELEQSNERIERLKNEKWICDTCSSEIDEKEAKSRLAENLCPICGQWSELAVSFQEYQMNRKKMLSLRNMIHEQQHLSERKDSDSFVSSIAPKDDLDSILANIKSLDREISNIEEEYRQITREHSAVNPPMGNEVIHELKDQLKQTQSEIDLFEELLKKSRDYLDNATINFIEDVNSKFQYYQREIFDKANFLLTPSYGVISEDNQIFSDLSFGEKNLLDLAFRMAVIEILHSKGIPILFNIDTPEESLDIAMSTIVSNLLNNLVKKLSGSKHRFIVIATSSKDFVENLDSSVYRVENLLKKSLNVRKIQFKQLSLAKFIS
ncbi:MAG: hypothetical protein HeimC3_11900 [Candidatus Heimdallarchaeota archaeon LC_3]|nr:MAG: hypothetical protein HeimC3_11900 [Candidatus Heimdallarchaeota archaeon LC_3]